MKKFGLLPKLILGIILGIIVGLICKSVGNYTVIKIFNTFGKLFGNFLNFMVPLVIVGFIIPGIENLGKSAGKLLAITAGIAYLSAITAGFVAFLVGRSILPSFIQEGTLVEVSKIDVDPFFEIGMEPLMGVMTALILAFILGIGIAYNRSEVLSGFANEFMKIVTGVVKMILIPFMPLYVATIFAKLTAQGKIVSTMSSFGIVFAILLTLQVLYVVVQYLIAFALTGKSPIKSIKNILPAYFTAVGTQSSAATIPVTLQCALKNEVSEEIADFVIPLGATIHLAGDTITLVLAAMGVMMLSGMGVPTLAVMGPYILMLGVTMVAAPGIPGGGVMAALGLMQKMLMFGQDQLNLMIALHFAQDSFGTATNVSGDGAIAMIIDYISKKSAKSQNKNVSA